MKNNKAKCSCKKNKPMTLFQAGCEIVNKFLSDMRSFMKDYPIPAGMNPVPFYEVFGPKEVFEEVSKSEYGTLDGNPKDLEYAANFAFYIVQSHVKLGDIHTIDYVKLKKFEDGQMGWTSVHYPT